MRTDHTFLIWTGYAVTALLVLTGFAWIWLARGWYRIGRRDRAILCGAVSALVFALAASMVTSAHTLAVLQ